MADSSLSGRIAVVTGASRGLGKAVALALAKGGATVLAPGRSAGSLDELVRQAPANAIVPVAADLRDDTAFVTLAAAAGRFGRLDMLVASAGLLGPITTLDRIAPATWRDVLAVNVTANWSLIRALHPLLLKSPAGRAVFVSAGIARRLAPEWGAYATSKSALEALVRTYALEVSGSPARVNLFNPGPIRTGMRRSDDPADHSVGIERPNAPPAEDIVPDILAMLRPDYAENGVLFDFPTRRVLRFAEQP